jgi:hypothetical protein
VRSAVGVALVTVCLGLAGCSLFGKKHAAQNNNPKPFLGTESPAKAETAVLPRENSGPLPGANGLLAGRVIVEATGRPIRASIMIKNRDREDAKEADLDIATDESGYFTIPKLYVGENYELIARTTENGELISGRVWAKPPKPTLLILLDKRFNTKSTPPPPEMPKMPGKNGATGKENAQERTSGVSIEAPVRMPEQDNPPRGGIAVPTPATGPGATSGGGTAPNPANIADGGFRRITQPSDATVTIPPPPQVPGKQQWESIPDQGPSRSAPAMPGSPGSVRMPSIPTPVPSCGLYGNRLDNFALYDLNGKVWEYKHDRRGRLTLLDFWRHDCGPCLYCIPYLVELQRDFGAYGLEVIGIACEVGTIDEQLGKVRPTINRKGINYKILLSGGGSGRCPVMKQFQVEALPCLVLIDESGSIIWRSPREGMSDQEHYSLRRKINDYLVTRQSP